MRPCRGRALLAWAEQINAQSAVSCHVVVLYHVEDTLLSDSLCGLYPDLLPALCCNKEIPSKETIQKYFQAPISSLLRSSTCASAVRRPLPAEHLQLLSVELRNEALC